jgi:hypothetical protein
MKKRSFLVLVVAGLITGSDDAQDKALRDLMQRKLKASQTALEGLALGDFDRIAKNADELILVSKDAEWKVVKSPQYELFSNEFRRRAENLGQAARDRNLDGASLAFVELTLSCVKCHKHVREVRTGRLDRRNGASNIHDEQTCCP